MFKVQLVGGPHDGRMIDIPEYVDEVLVPNRIPLDILYVEKIFNSYTFEPPAFTNSSYKSHTNMDEFSIEYRYAGNKR